MADSYGTVLKYSQRIVDLEKVDQLMRWDADTKMPPKGSSARASQRESLAAAEHRFRTDPELGVALETLEDADLTDEQAAVVREVRREYEVETNVSDTLHADLSGTRADAHEAWKIAREENDWSAFAPHLDRLLSLQREWATEVDSERDPFEVLWSARTGYLSNGFAWETVESILDDLREALVPLIKAVAESDTSMDDAVTAFEGPFDSEIQMALSRDALSTVGLSWERTRLDLAPHPFSYGTPFDVRMTTRFAEQNVFDGLTSTLHEFGHTAYAHGLPEEQYGTPLGEPRDVSVHESQSRFFENHIARTREFWELFLPTLKTRFPRVEGTTVEDAYRAINRVHDDNAIRVEADELTYHLHIILRTELARTLVSGSLTVENVPHMWNERLEEYLGVTPDTVAEGALQDPHWCDRIPAFATYTIGSVLAAQLYATMAEEFDVMGDVAAGDFDRIHEWLTMNVHRYGRRYSADELVQRATGEPLTADYFVDYVTEKYGDLYAL